ncbi:hypothetical protein A1O1_03482 [Capronia coronata CBS 617.96]|uniref:Clr5 domain-containing protein n=1 Tax=Capronia coronata CBS 617.96 TaxID=1182541 RepID=W9YME1_9EURO|nr:uncharacterized protein A1O1_03482 [Capronia coronata CBS 617.96]EXJ90381.1 hypothetical protein A1O1_03482 [Capronia coronata CBS 617.96]
MSSSPATSTSEQWRAKPTPAPTPSHLEAREGPAAAQWQAVKEVIRVLYEKKPLRDVKRILEQQYGFRATERMFKARLSQWGISKNYSDRDYQICAVLSHHRYKKGKASTAFMIHGHKRTLRDLHKYIKGRKMSEEDFLASALKTVDYRDQQQPPVQYAHVRAYTPEPELDTLSYDDLLTPTDLTSWTESVPSGSSASGSSCVLSHTHTYTPSPNHPSPSDHASPGSIFVSSSSMMHLTPSATQSHCSYLSPAKDSAMSKAIPAIAWSSRPTPFESSPLLNPPKLTLRDEDQPASSDQDISPSITCQRLGRDVEYMALQVVDAPPLKSLCGHDDIRSWRLMSDTSSTDMEDYEVICPTCHDLTRDHFISLPNLELPARQPRNILNETSGAILSVPASSRGHEHSWRWVARCFAACIYLSRGNDALSRISLADADAEFEKMLTPHQDPKVLLALTQTLQILHIHDQGVISRTIICSAYNVAERVLGPDDPLTTIVRWMVYVADLNMRDRDITSSTLDHLHTQFVQRHGTTDPRSIASLYCYGYMLNVERQVEQAELVLRKVYELSCVNLGARHLQSISALTNLHRALERQGRIDEAIHVLEQAIANARETLGHNHPRRLESIRLLAIMHEGRGQMDVAESLYWRVLEGRVRMLGRNHQYTQGMKSDLETFLKRRGKWIVRRQKVGKPGAGGGGMSLKDNDKPNQNKNNKDDRNDSNHNSTSRNNNTDTPDIRTGPPRFCFNEVITAEMTETEFVESEAQLRMQDLFEWDPDEKWDNQPLSRGTDFGGGASSSGVGVGSARTSMDLGDDTGSQTQAF